MHQPEPPPTRWDVHWRMLGADFRVRPIFWASCVLLGIVYYYAPNFGGLTAVAIFCFWIFAVLLSLLIHEIGHVLTARQFGVHPRIVLSGLGGHVYGLDQLTRRRRILVLLSGPAMNGLLFGLLFAVMWLITDPNRNLIPIGQLGADARLFVGNSLAMLLMINALWGVLNILPLWPLDGGRIAVEMGQALLGRRGQIAALLLSLAVIVLLLLLLNTWLDLTSFFYRFDPIYRVYLVYYFIQALYCYAFWLSAFRALWDAPASTNQSSRPERAA